MHALHRILVYIPDVIGVAYDSEYKDDIREFANTDTEMYGDGNVFDWRETDTAGRWSGDYPDNVIYAGDDLENVIRLLEIARAYQQEQIQWSLDRIRETFGTTDVAEIIKTLADKEPNFETSWYLYYVEHLVKILGGTYDFDSMFYNAAEGNSFITDSLIERIRKNPKDYALVLFDYHN